MNMPRIFLQILFSIFFIFLSYPTIGLCINENQLDSIYDLIRTNQYEKALMECDEIIKLNPINPKNAIYYSTKGLVYSKMGRIAESNLELDKALNLDEKLSDAHGVRGNNFIANNNYSDALIEYNKAIERGGTHPLTFAAKATALFKLNRFAEASKAFDYVLALNWFGSFETQSFHFMNGYALFQEKKYSEALNQFDQLISKGDEDGIGYYYRGVILVEFERYDEAIFSLDKSIILNPNMSKAYLYKSLVLGKKEKYQESLLSIDKSMNNTDKELENNEFLFLYRLRAKSLFHLGDYKESLKAIDEVIKLDSKYAGDYLNKEYILKAMNKNSEALVQIQKAILLDPSLGPIDKYQ